MSDILSFPGLGLEFSLSREAFNIGGLSIYWYGILIALAFLLAALYVLKRARTFGVDPDRMMDVILGAIVTGIIGARLYYVVFSWDELGGDLRQVINIRAGGLAIYGGIIFGVLGACLMCKLRKVKTLPCLDGAMGGLLIGQAIGRWGNFTNVEAFGSNTTLPWGMTSAQIEWYLIQTKDKLGTLGVEIDPTAPVHPTFLYESLWCILGFALVAWYTKRRRFDGEITLIYLGWYGLGRFFIEGLRTDPLLVGTVRVSQLLALLCVLASAVLLLVIHSRIRREGDPEYLRVYAETEEGKAVIAGEFYGKKSAPEEPAEPESTVEEGTQEPEMTTGELAENAEPAEPSDGEKEKAE